MSQPRVPDFFVVGHPKCGTTALARMLKRHPQIYMPVKEPRFFAPELRSRIRRPRSRRRADTLEGYLSLFAGARPDQRIGEATPSYLRSTGAATRIAQLQPDARIIAVFREPVSFLRSFHLQLVHNYVETEKDFRKAIELEGERREGKHVPRFSQSPPTLLYSDHVRYVEQLRRYHAVFSPEQVLVLVYDDFLADNEGTVRRVLRFLEVDDTRPVEVIRLNSLRPIRFLYLYQLERVVSVIRSNLVTAGAPSWAIRALTPRPAHEDSSDSLWRRIVYRPAPPPDEPLTLELRRRFRPEVVALSDYLGRDLVSLWGYDEG
jgi:sulfotransferase family protein